MGKVVEALRAAQQGGVAAIVGAGAATANDSSGRGRRTDSHLARTTVGRSVPPALGDPSPEFRRAVHDWLRRTVGLDPASTAEAAAGYQRLLAELLRRLPPGEQTIFAFAAPMAAQRLTTTVLQLAVTLAEQSDQAILIVDGNRAAPAIDARFGLPKSRGLREVLRGDVCWSDAIVQTLAPNLNLLPSGGGSRDSASEPVALAVRELFAALRRHYGLVLVDAGPLLQPASLELARQADGVCLVVQAAGMTRKPLLAAVRRLRRAGARVVGCAVLEDAAARQAA